jgi:hypothetical protein
MKVYIVEKEIENEYAIAKVSDDLAAEFELLHKERIVVAAISIQDALTQFAGLEKTPGRELNPTLGKFKGDRY